MSKYTPGPWKKEFHTPTDECFISTESRHIATVSDWGDEGPKNANLIACAPELLETLRDILPFVKNESAQKLIVLKLMKAEGKI